MFLGCSIAVGSSVNSRLGMALACDKLNVILCHDLEEKKTQPLFARMVWWVSAAISNSPLHPSGTVPFLLWEPYLIV